MVALTEGMAPRRGYAMVLMVISSVGISFGGLILRTMEAATTWQINFYRSLALMIVIAAILILRYRGQALAQVRDIGRPGLVAGCFLSCAGLAFLQAITNTTVANTLFTMSAIPFITAALAFVALRERLNRPTLVTMLIAAAGIVVMISDGIGAGSLYGNVMSLVTAICFAAFAVIVRRHRDIDMLPTLLVSGALVAAISLAATWQDLAISWWDLALCGLWGGILSGIGNAMFVAASRHLVAAELTLFMLLEFALGPYWVWLFVNEVPGRWTILGGGLVISAVAVRALIELKDARGPTLKRGRPSPM